MTAGADAFVGSGSSIEEASASRAGANSVVRSSAGESCCPSSNRRFHIHCARIWANSWPLGVREYQRSASCSTSSSASVVSNDPRCRYRSSTSEAVNERRGQVTSNQLVDDPISFRTNGGGRACGRMGSDDQTHLGGSPESREWTRNRRALASCHSLNGCSRGLGHEQASAGRGPNRGDDRHDFWQ